MLLPNLLWIDLRLEGLLEAWWRVPASPKLCGIPLRRAFLRAGKFGILQSLRLAKTSKIIKSNRQPNTAVPAKPQPEKKLGESFALQSSSSSSKEVTSPAPRTAPTIPTSCPNLYGCSVLEIA